MKQRGLINLRFNLGMRVAVKLPRIHVAQKDWCNYTIIIQAIMQSIKRTGGGKKCAAAALQSRSCAIDASTLTVKSLSVWGFIFINITLNN